MIMMKKTLLVLLALAMVTSPAFAGSSSDNNQAKSASGTKRTWVKCTCGAGVTTCKKCVGCKACSAGQECSACKKKGLCCRKKRTDNGKRRNQQDGQSRTSKTQSQGEQK
jgi:hypothetical protein